MGTANSILWLFVILIVVGVAFMVFSVRSTIQNENAETNNLPLQSSQHNEKRNSDVKKISRSVEFTSEELVNGWAISLAHALNITIATPTPQSISFKFEQHYLCDETRDRFLQDAHHEV